MSLLRVWVICAVAPLLGFSARAMSLKDLAASSDAIVVGSVSERQESGDQVVFDIAIDRVIKGDQGLKSVHVSHRWMRRVLIVGPAEAKIQADFRGIWFLLRTSKIDKWDVLASNGPDGLMPSLFIDATQRLPIQYLPAANAQMEDILALEIVAGVETGGRPEILLSVNDLTNNDQVQLALTDFTKSSTSSIRNIGVARLLQASSPTAVQTLRLLWPSIRESSNKNYVLNALRDSYRRADPTSVRQLVDLVVDSATDSQLRAAIVRALVAIHSKESLPFLATLLHSTDREEAMKGVYGLSSFANGCPIQTPANSASLQYLQFINPSAYRTKETIDAFAFRRGPDDQERSLISFWNKWWEANKQTLR